MQKIDREKIVALHGAVDALFDAGPEGPEILISSDSVVQRGIEDGGPGFMSVRLPRGVLEKVDAVCAALDGLGLWSPVSSVKIDGHACGCRETLLECPPEDEDFGAEAGEAFAMPAPEGEAPWESRDADGRVRSELFYFQVSAYGIEFNALPKDSNAPCFFYMNREDVAQALEACPAEDDAPGMGR